jgi:hypothetical protein
VITTLRTYLLVGFEILLPDKRTTAVALGEHSFGPDGFVFFFSIGNRAFFFFKPTHGVHHTPDCVRQASSFLIQNKSYQARFSMKNVPDTIFAIIFITRSQAGNAKS